MGHPLFAALPTPANTTLSLLSSVRVRQQKKHTADLSTPLPWRYRVR